MTKEGSRSAAVRGVPAQKTIVEGRQTFDNLVNELEGTEVEAKLAIGTGNTNIALINALHEYFSSSSRTFSLYLTDILHTSNAVDKYDSPVGAFSLLRRADGSLALKKKGRKRPLSHAIMRDESKEDISSEGNPLVAAAEQFGISVGDIVYLGSYEREKHRILVVNKTTGRVYTLNADRTTLLNEQGQPTVKGEDESTETLRQLEIEYKGMLPEKVIAGQEKDTILTQIGQDIDSLEEEILSFASQENIHLATTTLTKRKWMLQQRNT